jgi:hypothetical protein
VALPPHRDAFEAAVDPISENPRSEIHMIVRNFLFIALTMLAPAIGCNKERPADEPQAKQAVHGETHAEDKHAPAGVVPGSHEDWCDEHQVPESLCTRCNPSLAAAFKATGDWCEEHGLPESQCLICNPNLKIVRPPKKTGAQ